MTAAVTSQCKKKKKQFTDSCPYRNKEEWQRSFPSLTQHAQGPFTTQQCPAHPTGVSTATTNPYLHEPLGTGHGKGPGVAEGKPRDAQGCRKPILSLAISSILNHICKHGLKDIKIQKWPQQLPSHRSPQGWQAEQVLEPRYQQGQDERCETAAHELLQNPPTEEKEYYFMFIKM